MLTHSLKLGRKLWLIILLLGATMAFGQGILGRRTLGNLNVNTLKESELNSSASSLGIQTLTKAQQAELLKQRMLQEETFQKLRSRLPEEIANDSSALKDYVKGNIFRDTLIFGSELFSQGKLDFAPNLSLANTPNYILGSGDEVNITIYGVQEASYDLEISASGTLTVPYVGVIQASGFRLESFEARLKQKMISAGYPGISSGQTKLAVNVNNVRTISVTVVGASKPGNYSLPAVATVMHALYAASGPGNLGSYRNIQLIRNSEVAAKIDLYDLLVTGKLPNNNVLQEGDVIFIPVYSSRVNLLGEYKRPGLFESKEGESLEELITYAGGFSEGAFKDQVIIFSTGETELLVSDVQRAEYDGKLIAPGDVILALPLRNRYSNKLALTGAVVRPGFYEWKDGQTLQNVLKRAGGFDRGALQTKAVLIRRPEDAIGAYMEINPSAEDIALMPNDSVHIGMMTDFLVYDSISVRGFVKQPGKLLFRPGLTLEQAILLSGGITYEGDLTAVEVSNPRLDDEGAFTGDFIIEIIKPDFNGLGKSLNPGATIAIRSRKYLNTSRVVYFTGAVQTPGGYSLRREGESLAEVYARVGGLVSDAMPKFGLIVRKNPQAEASISNLYRKRNVLFEEDSIQYLSEEFEQIKTISKDTIAIDFTRPAQLDRIGLEDGDTVFIPRQLNIVYVRGNVKNQGGHSYITGRRANYYIGSSGGLKSNASTRDVVVEYANGKSAGVRHFMGLFPVYPRVYSNSTITVQDKPKKRNAYNPGEWAALTSSLASVSSITLGIIYLFRP